MIVKVDATVFLTFTDDSLGEAMKTARAILQARLANIRAMKIDLTVDGAEEVKP